MKTFFALFFALIFALSLTGQLEFVPLTHNGQLLKGEAANDEMLAASPYADIIQLNVQTLKTDSICVDLFLINEAFERLDYDPSGIIGGDVEIEGNCVIFEAGFIQFPVVDSIDLFIVDETGGETPVLLIVKTRPALQLPFVDNFFYSGPYPNDDLWLDRSVFINRSLAFEPITLGAATFDGTNEEGVPYGGGTGISDHLTSSFIDLSDRDFPVLQFYYQARGRGFAGFPRKADSLILEFRNQEGDWSEVKAYPGIGSEDVPPFQYEEISISEDFRYEGFQFRFKNISRRDGVLGLWHIDNIRLIDEQVPTQNIPDISLISEPSGILSPYRALPYNQFRNWISTQTADSIDIAVSNNFPSTQEVSISRLKVNALPEKIPLIEETLLEVPPVVNENQRTLVPGRFNFTNEIKRRNGLINALQNLTLNEDDSVQIEIIYEIEPENEGNEAAYQGNNTVRSVNDIRDYFAYDDGSAEVGIYVQGTGQFDMVAQEYEAIEGDTLKAVRMMFPFVFAEGERQRFELMVWIDSLKSTPDFSRFYDQPIFGARHKEGPASFTNFSLKTPLGEDTTLYIPKGKFYVGWRQVSSSSPFGLYLGFDRDSPEATSRIFFNTTGTWNSLSGGTAQGAIMIRPVFGSKPQITTAVNHPPLLSIPSFEVYPNPTGDFLYLKDQTRFGKEAQFVAINSLGQKLFLTHTGNEIRTGNLVPGLYTLLWIDENSDKVARTRFVKK
jgi:hypothetical protein